MQNTSNSTSFRGSTKSQLYSRSTLDRDLWLYDYYKELQLQLNQINSKTNENEGLGLLPCVFLSGAKTSSSFHEWEPKMKTILSASVTELLNLNMAAETE